MSEIVNSFVIGGYCVLQIKEPPSVPYNKVKIDGKEYDIIPIYDAKNCIAIKAFGDFKGKQIVYI